MWRAWHSLQGVVNRVSERCRRYFGVAEMSRNFLWLFGPYQYVPDEQGPLLFEPCCSDLRMLWSGIAMLTPSLELQMLTRTGQPQIPAGCIAEIRLLYGERLVYRVYLSMLSVRHGGILTVYWLLVPAIADALPASPFVGQ